MGSYCCKTVQWISQLHDALPPKWQPRTFADANCLTRRIAVLEKVMEYIIHLTNQHNALGGPPLTWTTLPLTTQSVFEVYPDRKEQHAQVVSRLKALLGLVHVKKISDTFELAYVRIGELQRELGSLTPSDADNGSLCVRDIKSALHATGTPATKRLLDIGSSSDRAPTRRAHRVLKPQPDSTRKRHAV
ncbi:hypothetical protein C8R43DRAFT_940413 [Mycena crocata]|nr:hypothetical protein C8R43DRAFT_940413 [Mycena crocata]